MPPIGMRMGEIRANSKTDEEITSKWQLKRKLDINYSELYRGTKVRRVWRRETFPSRNNNRVLT
jgi:hypothetical protein